MVYAVYAMLFAFPLSVFSHSSGCRQKMPSKISAKWAKRCCEFSGGWLVCRRCAANNLTFCNCNNLTTKKNEHPLNGKCLWGDDERVKLRTENASCQMLVFPELPPDNENESSWKHKLWNLVTILRQIAGARTSQRCTSKIDWHRNKIGKKEMPRVDVNPP